jgi:vacuolar-type H+-ATPase subunit H
MKKIIKLTEADLTRIIKRVIEEQPEEVGDNISNKPEKLSTAEEFWYKNTGQSINQEEYQAMVEFAKMHVKAALEAAANEYYPKDKENFEIVAGRFINAYPMDKIK